MKETSAEDDHRITKKAAFWFAVVAVIGAAAIYSWTIFVIISQFAAWQMILEKHFAAIVGLPGAAAAAFVLVVFLRQTEGPIEFEGAGFKLKGAAGQILMWVVCFLSISGAIKLVW